MKLLQNLLIFTFTFLLVGCVTKSTTLRNSNAPIPSNESAVVFVTIQLENVNAPAHLDLRSVRLFNLDTNEHIRLKITSADEYENGILVVSELKPGRYRLVEAKGKALQGKFEGTFTLSLEAEFEALAKVITYLGAIRGEIHPRLYKEQNRAGAMLPIMAQAKTGLADGTFRSFLRDNMEADKESFYRKFPKYKSLEIVSSLLKSDVFDSPPSDQIRASAPLSSKSERLCSVDQILGMKKLGLDDDQIRQACLDGKEA